MRIEKYSVGGVSTSSSYCTRVQEVVEEEGYLHPYSYIYIYYYIYIYLYKYVYNITSYVFTRVTTLAEAQGGA